MKETIIRSFSKAASTYDAYAVVQKEVINLLSIELEKIHFQNDPERILEIGCGTGNYTDVLAKRFKNACITAVDISNAMVYEARKKFFLHKSVRFYVEDAESMPHSLTDPYDLVTSNGVLHWFDDIEKGLKTIREMISENGIILAAIFGRETLKELRNALKKISITGSEIPSSFFPDHNLLSSIFNDLFPGYEMREHMITRTYPDLITFLRTLKMTGTTPGVEEKPIIRHPSALKKMENVFFESYGKIQATYQVFICCGRKVKKREIVTIDGPAGAGKSTISREVARHLGFVYLDTGAMYRAMAWLVQMNGISTNDSERICSLCRDTRIAVSNEKITVNDMDVTSWIRTPEMDILASAVSRMGCVREILSGLQRKMGMEGGIVAEGRDMGTVVFPDAKHKFFLTASSEERARRRKLQLEKTGYTAPFDEILAQIKERDKNDSERNLAPLTRAHDAVLVDSSSLSIDEVVKEILKHIK